MAVAVVVAVVALVAGVVADVAADAVAGVASVARVASGAALSVVELSLQRQLYPLALRQERAWQHRACWWVR